MAFENFVELSGGFLEASPVLGPIWALKPHSTHLGLPYRSAQIDP